MKTLAKISHALNVFNLFMKTTAGNTVVLLIAFIPQMAGTSMFANAFFSDRIGSAGYISNAAQGMSWGLAITFGIIVEFFIYFFAIQRRERFSIALAVVSFAMSFLGWVSIYESFAAIPTDHLIAIFIISALPPFVITKNSAMLASSYNSQHDVLAQIEKEDKDLIVANYRSVVNGLRLGNKKPNNQQGQKHQPTVQREREMPPMSATYGGKASGINMFGSNQ